VGDVTIGIDIGTTSVKAVAADGHGRVLGRVRLPHRLIVPAPDRLEHDANQAWRLGPRRALTRLAGFGPRAVAISSLVPSMTAVDAHGRPLTPGLLYGDARGSGRQAGRWTGADDGEIVGFVHWSAAAAPQAAGYWPAPAVATFALAREAVIDFATAASSAPLFDGAGWDAALCASCGVGAEQLPKVAGMGTAIGRDRDTGALVAAGGVDALCEGIVAGAGRPGDVLVHCGTTLIVWVTTTEPRAAPGLWTTPSLAGQLWQVGGPSNAGGLFLGWLARVLGRDADAPPPDPGNVPVWVPYIRGERALHHDPSLRASLHGLDLTHGPAALRRAGFEAAGFVVRHVVDTVGAPVHRVVAAGGGTRVPGWMQAIADCTGLPVHVPAVPEGAALGAAWLARMGAGLERELGDAARWAATDRVLEPDPSWQAAAAERYLAFCSLAGPSRGSGGPT